MIFLSIIRNIPPQNDLLLLLKRSELLLNPCLRGIFQYHFSLAFVVNFSYNSAPLQPHSSFPPHPHLYHEPQNTRSRQLLLLHFTMCFCCKLLVYNYHINDLLLLLIFDKQVESITILDDHLYQARNKISHTWPQFVGGGVILLIKFTKNFSPHFRK